MTVYYTLPLHSSYLLLVIPRPHVKTSLLKLFALVAHASDSWQTIFCLFFFVPWCHGWCARLRIERSGLESWGPFLESSETFLHPESLSKVLNLMITELLHSHTLNMNRDYLHTRCLRYTCPAAFKYRLTINGFADPEVPGTFQAYFANSCTVQGNVKLSGSQGCSDDKIWVDSSIFFNIGRFHSSILLSLWVFNSFHGKRPLNSSDSGVIFVDV